FFKAELLKKFKKFFISTLLNIKTLSIVEGFLVTPVRHGVSIPILGNKTYRKDKRFLSLLFPVFLLKWLN
ncbi:MAG: hypothetical protein PHY56_06415, partial [Candidatus Omnitrophica bacterium]|nr:hypothetical protein [Candidatus Omnitrophota bacterium]